MELLFKQAGITLVIWAKKESLLAARNKLNATLNARSGTSFKSFHYSLC